MRGKQIFAYLVAIALLISFLPACRQTEPGGEGPGGDSTALDHYRLTWKTIEKPADEVLSGEYLTEEALYYFTQRVANEISVPMVSEDGETVMGTRYEYEYKLHRLPHGSEEATCIYTTTNDPSVAIAPDGTLWIWETKQTRVEDVLYRDTYLKHLSPEGEVLAEVQLSADTYEGNAWMGRGYTGMAVDKDGYVFFAKDNAIFWVDAEHMTPDDTRRLEFEDASDITLQTLPDGRVQAEYADKENEMQFPIIDPATATTQPGGTLWSEEWKQYQVVPWASRYTLLRSDAETLYGEDAEGNREELLSWADFELSDIFYDIFVLKDNSILVTERTAYDETANLELGRFTPCTAAEAAKSVTIAGYGLDTLRELARQFNKTQSDYIVRVKDYIPTEILATPDYEKAMTQLNTELLAGDVPDIVSLDEHISANLLAAQGALEDLYAHIDKDVGRDFFVDGVLEVLESDGALYQLPTGFSIETMVANRDVVGDLSSLTFDQLKKLETAHPDVDVFHSDFSRDRYMSFLKSLAAVDFVDWSTGECTFDNGQFAKMLEMAKTRRTMDEIMGGWKPDDELITSAELLRQGRLLLSELRMTTVLQFYNTQKVFGEKSLYIGFPTAAGTGNLLTTTGNFAIMKGGQQKEGAWQFLCWMVKNYGETVDPSAAFINFPAERAAFDRCVAYYQNPEKGYVLTASDVAKLNQLIRTAKPATVYDPQIAEIIEKEASYFFAGKCTAQKAAANIQSRVQLYIMEQM